MSATVTLFDPTAPRRQDEQTMQVLSGLQGKVVGFIDNAKPNFHNLVDALADVLVKDYGVARVVKRRKKSASVPAPADMVADIVKECDLVITGSGD
jgi:hypothetical protein